MAIDFYKLGRKTGAKTPKGQQSGFQSLVGSAIKPIEDMLIVSKAATAALTTAMPAGVPIDKVPEELRVKATEFLTANKTAYTDATKVIASGINPQSQRFKDAVETINSVNTRFENLSNTLEDIAVKRKKALDDPTFSPATLGVDRLTFENLQNGSLYSNMTINEDGTFNYMDGEGTSKAWSDFAVTKQTFTGQNAYVGALEKMRKYKKNTENASWGQMENEMQISFDTLFQQLGPKGSADYAFADDIFLETNFQGQDVEELRKNPTKVVDRYKEYVMEQLNTEFGKMDAYKTPTVQMSAHELAQQAKQRQGEKQFNNFLKGGSEGGQMLEPPSPDQIATELESILGPTRIIRFNPEGEEKGFYYVKASDGEKWYWKKVASEKGIRWDNVKNLMDLKNIALN